MSECVCWVGGWRGCMCNCALRVECVTVCVTVCVCVSACMRTMNSYRALHIMQKRCLPEPRSKQQRAGDQDRPLHSKRKQQQHADEESDATQKAGTSAICTLSTPELHPSRPPAPIIKFTCTVADLKTNRGRQLPHPHHPLTTTTKTICIRRQTRGQWT